MIWINKIFVSNNVNLYTFSSLSRKTELKLLSVRVKIIFSPVTVKSPRIEFAILKILRIMLKPYKSISRYQDILFCNKVLLRKIESQLKNRVCVIYSTPLIQSDNFVDYSKFKYILFRWSPRTKTNLIIRRLFSFNISLILL